jgi:hypothetical protein
MPDTAIAVLATETIGQPLEPKHRNLISGLMALPYRLNGLDRLQLHRLGSHDELTDRLKRAAALF